MSWPSSGSHDWSTGRLPRMVYFQFGHHTIRGPVALVSMVTPRYPR